MKNELVIVIDFGGQYNQLVARRVRECNVYCEIYSYKVDIEKIKEMNTLTMVVVTNPGDFQPEQFLTNKEVKAANDPIMVYKK